MDFSETNRAYASADYERVREDWTRHAKVISDAGTVIEVWAVLKSWDFRQAYIESYGETYGLSEADRDQLRQTQMDAAKATFEFHVAVQTTTHRWNDLEKKDSPWKVTLMDGAGSELLPNSIQAQKLPELYETQFFPSRTAFTRTYLIKFSRKVGEGERPFAGAKSGQLALRIVSPVARTEVVWSAR